MEEYRKAISRFFQIYRPLQKKYGLRMHSSFSLYDDGVIEIWECEGSREKRCICKVKEKDDTACFERAAGILEIYGGKDADTEHEEKAG